MNARLPQSSIHAAAEERVAALVRAEIRSIAAYHVQKATGFIKLDAMENPYDLPADVRAEVAAATAAVAVNRYPDGSAAHVHAALRRAFGLPDELGLVLGNGSDELIQIITAVIARPGAVMLAPEPTFVMYRMNALFWGMRFVGVPLRPDFALDAEAMLQAVERERPSVVFIAYPNNPTGNLFAPEEIERILEATPGLVVVDEAYQPFADDTFLPRLARFPNLVVLRTVSKLGMAGLRLGYAVGAPAWIREFDKVRPPYNLGAITQAVAPVLLGKTELLAQQAAAIRSERARLAQGLGALAGVGVYPSQTNFVLIHVPDAPRWDAALRAGGILVKNMHGYHPLLDHCLRITVGTPGENDAVLRVLNTLS